MMRMAGATESKSYHSPSSFKYLLSFCLFLREAEKHVLPTCPTPLEKVVSVNVRFKGVLNLLSYLSWVVGVQLINLQRIV